MQPYPGSAGGTPNRFWGSLTTAKRPSPVDPLAMIAFEPIGKEIRIVLPDAVGAVVHGRVRLFLSDYADAYLATAGEGSWPGITGKSEPVTIYYKVQSPRLQ